MSSAQPEYKPHGIRNISFLKSSLHVHFYCVSEIEKKSKSWWRPRDVPARVVLGMLSFGGFLTNYMLRVNLNIAIVSMTGAMNSSDASAQTVSECRINTKNLSIEHTSERVSTF